jgi:transposase InsO family protein
LAVWSLRVLRQQASQCPIRIIFRLDQRRAAHLQAWPARAMARRAIVEYIAWHNGTRLHSTLGYRSPADFEETNKIKKVA